MENPFIPQTDENPFLWVSSGAPSEVVQPTGATRVGRLLLKGATFGLAGQETKPEGFMEHATEFLGSVPSVVGVSAAASPVAGAALRGAGLARLAASPTATRLAAAGLAGTGVGGVRAVATGDITEIPKEAGAFVAGEAIGLGVLKGLAKLKAARTQEIAKTATEGQVTELPTINPPRVEQPGLPGIDENLLKGRFGPGATQMQFPGFQYGPPSRHVTGAFTSPNRFDLDDFVVNRYELAYESKPESLIKHIRGQLDLPDPTPLKITPSVKKASTESAVTGITVDPSMIDVDPNTVKTVIKPLFRVERDADGVPFYVPITKEADDAVQLANIIEPQQESFPFAPEQLSFLNSSDGRAIAQKFKLKKDEQIKTSTSAIAAKPEAEAARLVEETTPVRSSEIVIVKPTPASIKVKEIWNNNGLTSEEVQSLMVQAREHTITLMKQAGRDVNDTKAQEAIYKNVLKKIMGERCK